MKYSAQKDLGILFSIYFFLLLLERNVLGEKTSYKFAKRPLL